MNANFVHNNCGFLQLVNTKLIKLLYFHIHISPETLNVSSRKQVVASAWRGYKSSPYYGFHNLSLFFNCGFSPFPFIVYKKTQNNEIKALISLIRNDFLPTHPENLKRFWLVAFIEKWTTANQIPRQTHESQSDTALC